MNVRRKKRAWNWNWFFFVALCEMVNEQVLYSMAMNWISTGAIFSTIDTGWKFHFQFGVRSLCSMHGKYGKIVVLLISMQSIYILIIANDRIIPFPLPLRWWAYWVKNSNVEKGGMLMIQHYTYLKLSKALRSAIALNLMVCEWKCWRRRGKKWNISFINFEISNFEWLNRQPPYLDWINGFFVQRIRNWFPKIQKNRILKVFLG